MTATQRSWSAVAKSFVVAAANSKNPLHQACYVAFPTLKTTS
ncbi:hypothetical protein [Kovacikia minuta]|nr:hypothetical protein [Kovacikia minuta]